MKKWLLGITCMLMMLGLIFSAGCGRQPTSPASDRLEVRNNGTAIQWKYSDETDWHDLVALDELRGAAGENGKDGIDAIEPAFSGDDRHYHFSQGQVFPGFSDICIVQCHKDLQGRCP